MSTPINPGIVTTAGAMALSEGLSMAEATARLLDKLEPHLPDEFPARLTGWSAALQKAAWTEEDYDTSGARYVKPGGRSGVVNGVGGSTKTWGPAVPVGNGLMPPDSFPVSVWLRRRIDDTSNGANVGEVYEFDWVCACAGAGSGTSGSGGGGVLVSCCPGAVPTTLTVTLALTSGACTGLDGTTATITWNGSAWNDISTPTIINGTQWFVSLTCDAFGWHLTVTTGEVGCDTNIATDCTIVSCSPLHLTATGFSTGVGCPTCPSITFDATVTE